MYKEKLGGEHELTVMTRQQLMDIIERETRLAYEALDQAEVWNDPVLYQKAEVMYKQVRRGAVGWGGGPGQVMLQVKQCLCGGA